MSRSIKVYLYSNQNKLFQVLKYFGYHNFRKGNNELRCAKPQGSNATVCAIKLNPHLSSRDFSSGFSGDLFGLIQHHTKLSYYEVHQIISNMMGSDNVLLESDKVLFDGFFNNDTTHSDSPTTEVLTEYEDSILENYEKVWNLRFVEDGILPKTQEYFEVGYDLRTHRITIPWRNKDGKLIGVMGRLNSDEETTVKYFPLIRFPKNLTLYNIQNIEPNRELFAFESEKSVMLSYQYGYKNAVALGGNAISDTQLELIKEKNIKRLIIGYDEGLDYKIIRKNLLYLRQRLMFSDIQVQLIYDKDNLVIEKGSKDSPVDKGKEKFEMLLKNHIRTLR